MTGCRFGRAGRIGWRGLGLLAVVMGLAAGGSVPAAGERLASSGGIRGEAAAAAPLRGDLDGNGAVDAQDAAILAGFLAGSRTSLPPGGGSADLDFDGAVTLLDLVTLLAVPGSDLAPGTSPPDNPLKGFLPYDGAYEGAENFPHSLEWFYLPLKDLQTGFSTFTWGALDAKLNGIAGRGHQAVFRVYLDYPDLPYGMPAFLSHVPFHTYTDHGNGTHHTSYSPDYAHADLRTALRNFIAALGARYDGDPRIGFITVGLLGFWGEWHTWPHEDWMASVTVMNEVLDAYGTAFDETRLLVREPKDGTGMGQRRLGFHDDSFAYSTLPPPDWHFWALMTAAGLQNAWRWNPIGGEVRPEVQDCIWDETPCTPSGQGYELCVDTTHASWLLNQGAFEGLVSPQRERAEAGARRLGYDFGVTWARGLPTAAGRPLAVDLKIRNSGRAPFYYDWPVELGAADASGNLAATWTTGFDLTLLQPGTTALWSFVQPAHGLPGGSYTLLMRVVNPLPGGKPLRFANAGQDRDRPGWLTLGPLTVQP